MDKVTASGLLLCAAALMALAGGLAMRASDKDVYSGEQRR